MRMYHINDTYSANTHVCDINKNCGSSGCPIRETIYSHNKYRQTIEDVIYRENSRKDEIENEFDIVVNHRQPFGDTVARSTGSRFIDLYKIQRGLKSSFGIYDLSKKEFIFIRPHQFYPCPILYSRVPSPKKRPASTWAYLIFSLCFPKSSLL